jgi:hypothetical protein
MPAKSKAQRNLMAAAEHGADFPKAAAIRSDMTLGQLRDFASTPTKGLPAKAKSSASHPKRHLNLGKYLHKAKGAK